jgi:hypothetical protein
MHTESESHTCTFFNDRFDNNGKLSAWMYMQPLSVHALIKLSGSFSRQVVDNKYFCSYTSFRRFGKKSCFGDVDC